MEEAEYIDLEAMQERADEENRRKAEEVRERMRQQREASLKERAEQQELFNKAWKASRD